MLNHRLRGRVAREAARLLHNRDESELHRAKIRAARQVYQGPFGPKDLPTRREIQKRVIRFTETDRRAAEPEGLGPVRDLAETPPGDDRRIGRFQHYALLLEPLEKLSEGRRDRPEGDVLYHSLQVFERARAQRPYDEEFLLAALLHDVGKAIDPREHAAAACQALEGFITPRTAWLIEHHSEALALANHTLGARCRHRLQASEDFEELMLLARCDREGHSTGVAVPDLHQALAYLDELAHMCGE